MLSYLYTLIPLQAQEGMMWLALVAGCSFLFGFFVSMGFKTHMAMVAMRQRVTTYIKYKIKMMVYNFKERLYNWTNR